MNVVSVVVLGIVVVVDNVVLLLLWNGCYMIWEGNLLSAEILFPALLFGSKMSITLSILRIG